MSIGSEVTDRVRQLVTEHTPETKHSLALSTGALVNQIINRPLTRIELETSQKNTNAHIYIHYSTGFLAEHSTGKSERTAIIMVPRTMINRTFKSYTLYTAHHTDSGWLSDCYF